MIREGVISIINPLDLYAIEEAILLKEQWGGEIIVISMGPAKAMEAVKEAIAMGCDEGYLISDRKFAGADTWATSYVLAKAIEQIETYDLILCGERATDGDKVLTVFHILFIQHCPLDKRATIMHRTENAMGS